jgi:16S rRNA (adenine1518-N6/adenine1519-N6)-dimethyltransferase
VLHLERYQKPPVDTEDPKLMFGLIRATFNQRRKTLVNSIANFGGFSFSREEIREAIKVCGLDENVRGETLSLVQFAELADVFHRLLRIEN